MAGKSLRKAKAAGAGRRFGAWLLSRDRIIVGLIVGIAMWFALPELAGVARLLVGWDAGVAVFLAWTWSVIATASVDHVRRRAAEEDERSPIILIVMLAAVVASLAGIVAAISGAGPNDAANAAILSIATLVVSWLTLHTMFALHYAHLYYGDSSDDDRAGGVVFPGPTKTLAYGDFAYLALCIGMTCQVSDVNVTDNRFRRLIAAHGVLSFFYNTFVLALAINLLGGIFGGR